MPDQVWYRSLYWRFALGFVTLLATLLGLQVFIFMWMTGRMPELFPSRTSAQFANAVAGELGATLKEQPDADLGEFINKNYPHAFRAFVIAMKDCRMAANQLVTPQSSGMLFDARRQLGSDCGPLPRPRPPGGGEGFGRSGFGRGGDPGRGSDPGHDADPGRAAGSDRGGDRAGDPGRGDRGNFRGDPRGGRGRGFLGLPPGPRIDFAPVMLDNEKVGMVAVANDPPPFSATMRDMGPLLAIEAFAVLFAGTAIAAFVVFGPTSRRLRSLQQAAIALGSGASGVRAPESGRDEVSSLARAFNEMAGRLEDRSAALEASNRTRRQLLADVSHELTTPLAAIRGYVETLGMTNLPIDEPTRARYLGIINEETVRLEHIVGDLLDLAKLEGGGGTFKFEEVSVAQLFVRVQSRHQPVVQQKHIDLQTIVKDAPLTVNGDSNRLEQALQNLVANAVRHTPDGGRIVVQADRVERGIRISVQDTGPGIPPEHLPHIFDRFYKVDVSRTGTVLPSGSGLGLSIVQAIVARHGGTVTASNPEEGGARIEILLPHIETA